MQSLEELRERRAYECRLTPDRALRSLDEAEEFLRDRGLLTRTADSALPSLYEACHEEPYRPGGRGFATWPATKWPWFGELADRGYLVLSVHRGKNVVVTDDVLRPAASLSPGERTRAGLALLAARGVNCLVLDEPTNHLDVEAIEELERGLAGYDGTVVLVTHDRRFLEAFAPSRTIEL